MNFEWQIIWNKIKIKIKKEFQQHQQHTKRIWLVKLEKTMQFEKNT